MQQITLQPLTSIPEIHFKDDLALQLIEAMERESVQPDTGDVLVVAHKIVSKAEGRQLRLDQVTPTEQAYALAAEAGKDPALVQLILDESTEVLTCKRGILMCRSRIGWTCANAGVDQSNTAGANHAILPPVDPDFSAKEISARLYDRYGVNIPVIISDTHGRPLREGIAGITLGCWGLEPLRSYIHKTDRAGREMHSSVEAISDELASAASLIMGQGAEGIPAVLVKGLNIPFVSCGSQALHRPPDRELFVPRPPK